MNNFDAVFSDEKDGVEKIIYGFCPDEFGKQSLIFEAMNYSVKAGGKRLRPILMLETFKLFGEDEEKVYPFMAAIEFIHTYSLVHDDLPAMDDDMYRRGRKTTHVVYGEAMGILAGDGLLNYGFEVASQAFLDVTTLKKATQAFMVLARKAGIYGMIGGQAVDVENCDRPMEKDKLDFIYQLKTGALIEASMMIGAIMADCTDAQLKKAEEIGKKIGLAFQIQDDILDVIGDEAEIGKPLHSDEKNHKTTYVTIFGIEKAKSLVEQLSTEALDALHTCPQENVFLEALIQYLIYRKK